MDTQPASLPPAATRPPSRKHRRRRLTVGAILAIVAVLVVFGAMRRHAPTPAKSAHDTEAKTPQSVTVAHAARGDVPVTLHELGTVTPLTTVTVKSQISGYLTQLAFHEGQDVKQGDFLAQVDPRPYQAVLEQYEGNLIRDQALLRNAQRDMERYQRLSKLDSISRQNVDTQAATVAQYEGAVKTDEGLIDAEKLNLAYAHITAPSDGRIGLRQVDVGNYVTPSDQNGIVVLTLLKPISVIFTIPQTELGQVLARLRQTALPVTALASDSTTVLGEGTVRTIDNQVDTTTGTVKLRALFANDDETLFPNAFVNVSLLVDTVHDAVVIPNEAVQRGTPGTYVYLVGKDNIVKLRTVTTGASAGGKTAITSGLAVGDEVVVQGTSRLRAGSEVKIVAAANDGASSAAP